MSKETTFSYLALTVGHRTLQTRAWQGAPRGQSPRQTTLWATKHPSTESSHTKLVCENNGLNLKLITKYLLKEKTS